MRAKLRALWDYLRGFDYASGALLSVETLVYLVVVGALALTIVMAVSSQIDGMSTSVNATLEGIQTKLNELADIDP